MKSLKYIILAGCMLLPQGIELYAAKKAGTRHQGAPKKEIREATQNTGWSASNVVWGLVKTNEDNPQTLGVSKFSSLGAGMMIEGTSHVKANVASWIEDGQFYGFNCIYDMSYGMGGAITTTILTELTQYDPTSDWNVVAVNNFDKRKVFNATSVAYNYSDGKVYGCFYNPATEEYEFAVADPATKEKTVIGEPIDGYWYATFFDGEGNLYCIDDYGWLMRVDMETGELEDVDDTGVTPPGGYDGCAVYDSRSGKAYWSVYNSKSSIIYQVDLETAETVKLFDVDGKNRVLGLCVPRQTAESGAPDFVSGINLSLPGGATTGTLSFTMPTRTVGGDEMTGTAGYKLLANGEVLASGEAEYGANVEVPVSFVSAGQYELALMATNESGDGCQATDIVFVGNDTPNAPANVKAEWNKGVFKVSWDAVEGTVNHAVIDPSEVTYTVTRFPGEKVVATDISATEFTETLYPEEDGVYYYTVTAKYAGIESEPSASNEVSLSAMLSNDVEMAEFVAPTRVEPGVEFALKATVRNVGINKATGLKVNLYRDGELMLTEDVEPLEYDETGEVTFKQTLGILDKASYEYNAEVVADSDDDNTNNASEKSAVLLHLSPSPMVTSLEGSQGDGVLLTWVAPDLNGDDVAKEITDDFESYPSWSMGDELGDWVMDDRDENYLCPDVWFPFGEIDEDTKMAYCVLDNTHEDLEGDPDFDSYSGNKYLASMCSDAGANDDWLISPELPMGGQTISLYAKSRVGGYAAETFEVLSSINGTKWTKQARFEKIPTVWTEYMVTLPEDAKYFAVRCVSDYCDMFFLDDITFIRKGGEYALLGYNVYRDGAKLNESPLAEASYHDTAITEGNHQYAVTAVYEGEESRPATINMEVSAIKAVLGADVNVTTGHHTINVRNVVGVEVRVVTADGKVVAAGNSEMSVVVTPGIYIVKVGTTVRKVLVK